MKKPFFAIFLLISLASSVRVRAAESKWIRMHTPNFDMLSSAGEKETRNTLQYFEQVREFFLKFNGHAPKEPAPVTIVIFGSEKEYAQYRPAEFAIAYFAPQDDRDYIVLGRTGEDADHIATHEYTHLIAQHAGLAYPPWLNEGLAELFSTFSVMNGSISIGDPIPGRILALREDRWVPLATIMAADRNSPYYNETGKAGSLYNEGWAAVHFIGTTKEYRPGFSAFLSEVAKGVPSAEAIQTVYGKSLAAFEAELRGYISQGAFNHLIAKIEIDRSKKEIASEPAAAFDVNIALMDIDPRPAAKADRRRLLEEMKKNNPKRSEPWVRLAYLDWEAGRSSEAVEEFSRAYALGARSNRMLWDFGRLARSARPQESLQALKDLVEMEPNRAEVRIELAWSQYYAREYNDALKTLTATTIETMEQAPRFYSALASIQLGLGDRVAASKTVDLLKRFAKTDADIAQAERLRRNVDSGTTPPGNEVQAQDFADLSFTIVKPTSKYVTITGTLAEFICPEQEGSGLKIAINTEDGKKLFSFKTAESISVLGKDDGRADLFCGPQDVLVRVKVSYEKSAEAGADGILKVLEFEP
jgi:tetratricopeptide (TPR) repeat protein